MEKREILGSIEGLMRDFAILPSVMVFEWLRGIKCALERDLKAEDAPEEDDAEPESPGFLVNVGAIEGGWRLEGPDDYAQGSRKYIVAAFEKVLRAHDARRGLAVPAPAPAPESLQAEVDTLKAELAGATAERDNAVAWFHARTAELERLKFAAQKARESDPGRPFSPDERLTNLQGRIRDLEDRVARLEPPMSRINAFRADILSEALNHIDGDCP